MTTNYCCYECAVYDSKYYGITGNDEGNLLLTLAFLIWRKRKQSVM